MRSFLLGVLLLAAVVPAVQGRSIPQPGQPVSIGTTPAPPPGGAGYRPAVNWQLQCAGCHLEDGRGARANDVPRLQGFVGRFLEVDGGREFLLRVPGVSQSALSDAETAALLNWIIADGMAGASRPADFQPFTEAEVARLRHQALLDLPGTRAKLIGAIRARGFAIEDGLAP